jgi:hypothetical protein
MKRPPFSSPLPLDLENRRRVPNVEILAVASFASHKNT